MKSKIKTENIEIGGKSVTYWVDLSINGKKCSATITTGITFVGGMETQNEKEIFLQDDEDLTDEEKEDVEEYVNEIDFSRVG